MSQRLGDLVLAKPQQPDDPASRLLIELAFVGDDALTPEQLAQQAQAYAWADELEAG